MGHVNNAMDTEFLLTCFEMHFKLAIVSCGINSPHYSCMMLTFGFLAVHVYNFCLCYMIVVYASICMVDSVVHTSCLTESVTTQ